MEPRSTSRVQMRPRSRMVDLKAVVSKQDSQECRIQAMDRSPDGKMLIVGGQNILRLVNLEKGCVLAHGANVRSTKHKAKHYAVSDLKFHPQDHLVASCSVNASVVLWHLARMGGGDSSGKMAEHKAKEHGGHQRGVHSLSWHPTKPKMLLTGSQDATMKLWDLRVSEAHKPVLTTFTGHPGAAVAVRSVQFHPGSYSHLFLAGLGNGQVQVWDMRQTAEHVCATLPRTCDCGSSRRPKPWAGWHNDSNISLQKNKFVRLQAHDQWVYSVQWHPTEKDWFASSGRDGMVHCWDLSKDVRNPVKSIKNMDFKSAVSRVAWRPGYESCLATCGGGLNDYKIHVWDADRPFLPLCFFKAGLPPERAKASAKVNVVEQTASEPAPEQKQHELGHDSSGHTDDVTGLLWLDENRLASCSKDGTVRIHAVDEGYRPYRGISTVTPAWSLGDVAVAGAPIVRDWTPKRDRAWLNRQAEQAERQQTGGRKSRSRSGSATTGTLARASGSAEELNSDAKDRDSRGSASDIFRRVRNTIPGAKQSTRDSKNNGTAGNADGSVGSRHEDKDAEMNHQHTSMSRGSRAPAGAPPLNPATMAVQWQSMSALGNSDGTTSTGCPTSSTVATVSNESMHEHVPEGGWPEQPYDLGYNTDLFEFLAKFYTMTPIFGTPQPSTAATQGSPNNSACAGSANAEAESSVTPRSATGTPRSSPRSTPTAAAAIAAATAAAPSEKTTVPSTLVRGVKRQPSTGAQSTPPSSPTRLSTNNVDSPNSGSQNNANGNGYADMASRREINTMLARLDRNAARDLGLNASAAVAALKSKSGSGTSEAERRAQQCLELGDVAVRDEDDLEKAVRWYLAGIAAVTGSNAMRSIGSSAGWGRTQTPLLASTHVAAATKLTVAELLAAQLDRRLVWARRRHCDGVAAAVRHNAAVALCAGQRELANCWQMLQALVTRDSDDYQEEKHDINDHQKNDVDGSCANSDFKSASPVGSTQHAATTAATAAAATGNTGLLDGLFGSSVERLASWFAERRGEVDLQSAVTLLLLVGRPYMWSAADAIIDLWPPHSPSEDSHGAEQTVGPPPPHESRVWRRSNRTQAEPQGKAPQQSRALTWCHAYIELLQRHKLDTLAMRVAHLSQCGAIQKLNQERAHFKAITKCLACDTELPPAPASAAKEAGSHCSNPTCGISQSLKFGTRGVANESGLGYVNARCGVCRLPVRGPWVWCQGCGHGGHLACYEKWFGHQRMCPTGCNHLCNLLSDRLELAPDSD